MKRTILVLVLLLIFSCLFAKTPDVNLEKGMNAVHQGKYKNAIKDLTVSLENNKFNAEGYLYRGIAYYKTKKYMNAEKDFFNAREIDPDGEYGITASIWNMFISEIANLKSKKMTKDARKIVSLFEKMPVKAMEMIDSLNSVAPVYEKIDLMEKVCVVYLMIASLYYHEGEIIKAAEHSEKAGELALSIDSINGIQAIFNAANVYLEAKEYKKAGDLFVRVGEFLVEQNDNFNASAIYMKAGDCYYDAGMKDQANDIWEIANELFEQ